MNRHIINLKHLIREYEEINRELEDMSNSWEYGTPEEAASCDPSDQYMKTLELEVKMEEIKEVLKKL